MKWSSSNAPLTDPATYKSYLKDMHKIKGDGIVSTVLQEGQEFMNNGISHIEQQQPNRNKKEIHIDKISQRELIPQTSMNPFFRSASEEQNGENRNYINDIEAQEKFLIPQNSNMYC